jgi:hypothetical protein
MSLIGSNLPRQRLGSIDAQTGSLVLDEHFRDHGSTHRGVSMVVLAKLFSQRYLPAGRGILALPGP